MVLVDTSVWIDHLRRRDLDLVGLLEDGQVLAHPFVIGELACGNLGNRSEILHLLAELPPAKAATHEESLALITDRQLHGREIGWVDVHLLAASLLSGAELWTRDRTLSRIAAEMAIALDEEPRSR